MREELQVSDSWKDRGARSAHTSHPSHPAITPPHPCLAPPPVTPQLRPSSSPALVCTWSLPSISASFQPLLGSLRPSHILRFFLPSLLWPECCPPDPGSPASTDLNVACNSPGGAPSCGPQHPPQAFFTCPKSHYLPPPSPGCNSTCG